MKRSLLFLGILSLTAGVQVSAADLSWGDPTLDSGQFKISGAVRSRYLHKDYVVDANKASQKSMMICVSRAKGKKLVLDL